MESLLRDDVGEPALYAGCCDPGERADSDPLVLRTASTRTSRSSILLNISMAEDCRLQRVRTR